MAKFEPAFNRTVLGNEGPYDNDPKDPGGETVWGITRKYQASWAGWGIIDLVPMDERKAFCTKMINEGASPFRSCVLEFYRRGPWGAIRGEDMLDQAVAEELFDSAINCGMVTAIKWLQRALNIFNRGGKDYPDMEVDGYLGNQTLEALDSLITRRGNGLILKALDAEQGMHYLTIAEKNPALEDFEAGWWANRIS